MELKARQGDWTIKLLRGVFFFVPSSGRGRFFSDWMINIKHGVFKLYDKEQLKHCISMWCEEVLR